MHIDLANRWTKGKVDDQALFGSAGGIKDNQLCLVEGKIWEV